MTPIPLRIRLFLMMLLEYAIWGAWAGVAGKYFTDPPPSGLGLPGSFSGLLFSLLPLGAIVSPVFIGQLADRWIRAEHLQGALCLSSGAVLLLMGSARDQTSLFWLMLVYALLFAPTTTLTNTIAFAHLKLPGKEFGPVRVGGTMGWFIALGCLAGWRALADRPIPGDLFYLAGFFSILFGVYAFTLPATRPQHKGRALPFIEALDLLKEKNFRVFSMLAFLLGCSLDFYYIFGSAYLGTPRALGGVGVSTEGIPTLLMLPQCSEVIVMATLGASLPRLGIKRAILIGFSAWALRYALLAASPTIGFAAGALLLHGFCFTFVFAVASLYVNEFAPAAIRASAQALVTIGLFGFGRFIGSHVSGLVHNLFTVRLETPRLIEGVEYGRITNWHLLYSVPLLITITVTVLFALLFREPKRASE